MASAKTGYPITPVPRDQNMLKVMPGFHSTLGSATLKPCSLVGKKFPSPRGNHLASPAPPGLSVTPPAPSGSQLLGFPMAKYLNTLCKDRKQGTSVLDLSMLGKSQGYITGSPVFEQQNVQYKNNIGGETGSTPRRNTLDPSQLLRKVVRKNSACSPAFAGIQNLRRNSLRHSFVDEKLSISSKILGTGGFGAVYLGLLNKNMVAVKKFHKQRKNVKAEAESFRSELTAKMLVHPNVVRILATSNMDDYSKGMIVMEYVGECNLHQVLQDTKRPLTQQKRLSYALDLARALEFVHNQSVVHLDVKPANILITTEGMCKLGDFGCCQVLENGTGRVSPTLRSYLTGTFAYRAPELLKGAPPCPKADIYSMGITMWQIGSRRLPYHGKNQHVVIFGVVAYNLRPDSESTPDGEEKHSEDPQENEGASGIVDQIYSAAYMKCWDTNPMNRPCASDLVRMLEPYVGRCD